MSNYIWNPSRLQFLIDTSKCSIPDICAVAGISEKSMRDYLSKKSSPNTGNLIALAEIFGVSIDYLIGRTNDYDDAAVRSTYVGYYNALRRQEYENMLLRKKPWDIVQDGYEGPYPYNLLDDIFGKPIEHILSDDEIAGLYAALESLSEREQQAISLHYFDGYSLKVIGENLGLSPERIRQIIHKGVRKLRHPSRANLIRYGADGYSRKQELDKREYNLISREIKLEELQKYLEEKYTIEELKEAEKAKYLEGGMLPQDTDDGHNPSLAFLELDMSVRSYNCFVRAGIRTVSGIIEAYKDGRVKKIRNMGIKSINEVAYLIKEKHGIDLFDYICDEKEI